MRETKTCGNCAFLRPLFREEPGWTVTVNIKVCKHPQSPLSKHVTETPPLDFGCVHFSPSGATHE